MSETNTPRTDEIEVISDDCHYLTLADHARQLETELAEAKEQILKLNEFENNDTQSELAAWELLRTTRAELASANALIAEAKKALEHVHIQFGGQLPDENCGCDSCLLLAPVVETLAKLKGREG